MIAANCSRPPSPSSQLRSGRGESDESAAQVLTSPSVPWLGPDWLGESPSGPAGERPAGPLILASAQVSTAQLGTGMGSADSTRRSIYSPRQPPHQDAMHHDAYMRHTAEPRLCESPRAANGQDTRRDSHRRSSRGYALEGSMSAFEYQLDAAHSHGDVHLAQDHVPEYVQYGTANYNIRLPSTDALDSPILPGFGPLPSNFGPLADQRISGIISPQSGTFSNSYSSNHSSYSSSLERGQSSNCFLPPQPHSNSDMVRSKLPRNYATSALPAPPLTLPGRAEYGPSLARAPEPLRTIPVASLASSPSCYGAPVESEFGSSGSSGGEKQAKLHFPSMERLKTIHTEQLADGSGSRHVVPELTASVDKNIFVNRSDNNVTCYRRNYISVQCSYELSDYVANGSLFLSDHETGGARMIQAFGVSLSATIDDPHGKAVDLVQHTAKRDKGPRVAPSIVVLGPSQKSHTRQALSQQPLSAANGPNLPLQQAESSRAPYATNQHTFERIQFSQATANNGRKRAQQQYYYLIVQLHADVRQNGEPKPEWKLVARLISDPIVVRGRSPGHYKETPGDEPSAASGGGHGARHAYGPHVYATPTRSSSMSGMPFVGGNSSMHGGGGCFRGQPYVQASPTLSHSGSVASSCQSDAKDHRSAPLLKRESSEYAFRASQEAAAHMFHEPYGMQASKHEVETLPSMYASGAPGTKMDESNVGSASGSSGWQPRYCGGFDNISNAGWAINAGL